MKRRKKEEASEDILDGEINTSSETNDEVEVCEAESVEISDALDKKSKECNELIDKLQRAMAEFDNYRKRTTKEKASMYNDGIKDLAEKLLPVIDNLERAVYACENKEDNLYKGVEMILKQFISIFESMNITPINTVGEKFDPNIHNAVIHIEDDNYGENEIVEEMQKGYICNNKVIRCSVVKVAN